MRRRTSTHSECSEIVRKLRARQLDRKVAIRLERELDFLDVECAGWSIRLCPDIG
ncbi:hypothetical protein [Rhizobium miluonense]|uniref:hypothetical protein n=1 Tax=Rhizobium miluonense TaxID=411945 RepID=UPI001356519A|nr:hypothetical protein [Rhizobium miluonense]